MPAWRESFDSTPRGGGFSRFVFLACFVVESVFYSSLSGPDGSIDASAIERTTRKRVLLED